MYWSSERPVKVFSTSGYCALSISRSADPGDPETLNNGRSRQLNCSAGRRTQVLSLLTPRPPSHAFTKLLHLPPTLVFSKQLYRTSGCNLRGRKRWQTESPLRLCSVKYNLPKSPPPPHRHARTRVRAWLRFPACFRVSAYDFEWSNLADERVAIVRGIIWLLLLR